MSALYDIACMQIDDNGKRNVRRGVPTATDRCQSFPLPCRNHYFINQF